MAKHKAQRALFELLVKQRGQVKAKLAAGTGTRPISGAETYTPPQQAAKPPPPDEPVPIMRRPVPAVVTRKAAIIIGGVRLTWPYLVIAGVVLVCLCYLFYALGARQPGDGLPTTEKQPTMKEIKGTTPVPGLVGPAAKGPELGKKVPAQPAPRKPGPGPQATRPPEGRTPPAPPSGPRYRVRIARIDVSQPSAIDDLRAFLARSGIQTDRVTRSGYHVLYSRRHFTDKTESDVLAIQINKALEAFEKETRRPTSKDAYTVKMN